MNSIKEFPIVFSCEDVAQVGIFHFPLNNANTAILMVVAGGPQYRVGRARQLITWARRFAEAGYPVLRFDYRGLGDSSGEFIGFERIDADIKSAIDEMYKKVPDLQNIILWGECNSTSSIMMYAWQDPRVKGMIIRDPWVRDESTEAKTYIKHYYWKRLQERSFWLKILHGQFNIFSSFASIFNLLKLANQVKTSRTATVSDFHVLATYQEKMLEGYSRFHGKTLLLMNGSSLTGKEFEVLVAASGRWQKVLAAKSIDRIDDEIRGDDNYSLIAYSQRIGEDALSWLKRTRF